MTPLRQMPSTLTRTAQRIDLVIDVLLLGTSGMHPTADRWLSSVLLRCGSELILFDCGEGTQIPWRRSHWGFKRVSTICITHWHADHIAGLPGVLFSIANAGRTDPVTLYGPVGDRADRGGTSRDRAASDFPARHHRTSARWHISAWRGSYWPGRNRRAWPVPSLAFRLDLHRARRFDRAKAEAQAVPRRLWRTLQQGQDVAWEGGMATADDILMPPRPGLAFGFVTDTRPLAVHRDLMRERRSADLRGHLWRSGRPAKAQEWGHMTFAEAATLAQEREARNNSG